jgi:tetratricopeptide (TPR) repeat protein
MNSTIQCPECGARDVHFLKKTEQYICAECEHTFRCEKEKILRRIFVSYGHDEHAALAHQIKRDLAKRGHEVWFDSDRLKPGFDWEQHIEEGLNWVSESQARGCIVLLMTPHSVRRPDGYCLNEIARAVSLRVDVVPIMAMWCEPPLSISRIQWLDMQDCIPIDEQGGRYDIKLERLAEALEKNSLDFEGTQSLLIHLLEPLPFEADIAQHLARFIGRQWVFKDIDRWLEKADASRIFWIVGDPGTGKTALVSWLCHHRREVAAFHLCSHGHKLKSDPRRCVMSIAYQLSTQLSGYQDSLSRLSLQTIIRESDARTLFDMLIAQPLSGSMVNPDRMVLVIIDALDAANEGGKNELASFIAREFLKTPLWLRLIITSRPDLGVVHSLQGLDPYFLNTRSHENQQDLSGYIERELKTLIVDRRALELATDTIVRRSQGVFLYAEWVCQELALGRLSLDRLEEFPQGLGGIYAQFFERQFPDLDAYETRIRPALQIISAAREPPTLAVLSAILSWNDYDRNKFKRSVGSLFKVEEGIVQPFHTSLLGWLTKEEKAGPYFVSEKEGHQLIVNYGYNHPGSNLETISLYMQQHLPAHMIETGRWNDVALLLSDLEFFHRAWAYNQNAVRAWWVKVEEHSSHRVEDVYRNMIEHPEGTTQSLLFLSELLYSRGHIKAAAAILKVCVTRCRVENDRSNLQSSLAKLGHIHMDQGRSHEAIQAYKEMENICRELQDWGGIQAALGNQGAILEQRGEFDLAFELYKAQEKICRDLGKEDCLATALNNQGLILVERGDLDGAMTLYKEQEKICRELGLQDRLQICLGNQADVLADREDFRAENLYEEQEKICREFGLKHGLQRSLGNHGMFLFKFKQYSQALEKINEKENICREMELMESFQFALGQKGMILLEMGHWDESMALFKEQEDICREFNFKRSLQWALWNQGEALRKIGEFGAALRLFDEQEQICRAIGSKDSLRLSLGSQASALKELGRNEEAMCMLNEQCEICREIGMPKELAASLVSRAELLVQDPMQRSGALLVLREAQDLAQSHSYTELLERIEKLRKGLP